VILINGVGNVIPEPPKCWEALTRFVDDGVLEIDSNLIENSIRPTALGKNYDNLLIMQS